MRETRRWCGWFNKVLLLQATLIWEEIAPRLAAARQADREAFAGVLLSAAMFLLATGKDRAVGRARSRIPIQTTAIMVEMPRLPLSEVRRLGVKPPQETCMATHFYSLSLVAPGEVVEIHMEAAEVVVRSLLLHRTRLFFREAAF